MQTNCILLGLILLSSIRSSQLVLFDTVAVQDGAPELISISRYDQLLAISTNQSYSAFFSKSGTTITLLQNISVGGLQGIGITDDALKIILPDHRISVGKLFIRPNTGTSLFSVLIFTVYPNSKYSCITGNGQFLGIGSSTSCQIYILSVQGSYNALKSIQGRSSLSTCEFSDDGAFFFLGDASPEIYKYDGNTFQSHQNITLAGVFPVQVRPFYRNPYLIYPEKDGGNANLKFFQHDANTDLWELAFQRAYPGTQFQSLDVSHDHKFIAVSTSASTVIHQGSVAEGYTLKQTIPQGFGCLGFTHDSQLLFAGSSSTPQLKIYIDCNWNTSGNFYLNSNTSTCEQCVGCLACSAPDDCSRCDETSNYFHDGNQTCSLCNISNCLTCDSLTTCATCQSGYEAQGNSTCEAIQTSEDSAGLSTGVIIAIVLGVMTFLSLLGLIAFSYVFVQPQNTKVPENPMESMENVK